VRGTPIGHEGAGGRDGPSSCSFFQPEEQFVEADPTAADLEPYGQVTSGFQSANIPAGLFIQIQACMR
jgi:hypothetical protein